MLDLMDKAKSKGADFIVYPELALTTFFPRWYFKDRAEADIWFEREMPSALPGRCSSGQPSTAWA